MLYKQYDEENIQCNYFKILTLGNFKIFHNNINLTEQFNNSIKIWELLKYFITYRDELILPERIISSICPNAEYTDPKRALRALIFRLRKILNDVEKGKEKNNLIVYSQGCYKLEANHKCKIDVDEFEKSFHTANKLLNVNTAKAIEYFYKVIDMYKGDYLSETYGYDWLLPVRNQYRRYFLQSVCEASELLKKMKRFQEVLIICEKALKFETFEELVHYHYIEALVGAGKIKQAINHYNYVIDLFERELGVKPSKYLMELKRLFVYEISDTYYNTTAIKDDLVRNQFSDGPVICNKSMFTFLYQLEKRRVERYGHNAFLGIITLSQPRHLKIGQDLLKDEMLTLKQILISSFRKSDVITEWNEKQLLVILPCSKIEQALLALERVKKEYKKQADTSQFAIYTEVQHILPSDLQINLG